MLKLSPRILDHYNPTLVVGWLLCIALLITSPFACAASSQSSHAGLPDKLTPFLSDADLPERTPPLLEIGDDFLGTGNLKPGFRLPSGAVWQPRFWLYGTQRSAIQHFDNGPGKSTTEWMNRLDLFGNLQLTGTERVLIGITPLHDETQFTGQIFDPDIDEGFRNNLNLDIQTLFFEGDLAELFPNWDYLDSASNDIGFSIGRQGIVFQDGMLIDDNLDGIGISRNNVRFEGVPWLVNLRTTFFFAWADIHRNDNVEDRGANLYGLFTQLDTLKSTIDVDVVYVESSSAGDDLVSGAIDSIQRIGKISTTFRIAASKALGRKSLQADDGVLLFAEISWAPPRTDNNAYLNAFVSIDNFTSPARQALSGGPLGRTGLLFAAPGIGRVAPAIGNRTGDSVGLVAGYQMFMKKSRRQLILEVGGRVGDSNEQNDSVGAGFRLQQAFGRRFVGGLNGYVSDADIVGMRYGLRAEILIKY